MGVLTGAVGVVAIVLVVSGLAKVVTPAATAPVLADLRLPHSTIVVRGLGVVEVAIGTAALLVGSAGLLVAVALLYLGFALVVVAARRAGTPSCGCFGANAAPPSAVHIAVNVCSAIVAVAAAVAGAAPVPRPDLRPACGGCALPRPDGHGGVARRGPRHRGSRPGRPDGGAAHRSRDEPGGSGADVTGLLQRTVNAVADRLDRRNFLGKAAVVGSAVVAAPLEFGLKPKSAYAAICNCSGSACACGSSAATATRSSAARSPE